MPVAVLVLCTLVMPAAVNNGPAHTGVDLQPAERALHPGADGPVSGAGLPRAQDGGTQGAVDDLERLTTLLHGRRFEAAVDLYRILYDRLSEAESEPYRRIIFAFADDLYAAEDHAAVVELMAPYVYIFYRDLAALSLLADSQHGLRRYAAEIKSLSAALDEAYLPADITRFQAKFEDAVRAQGMVLIEENRPAALVDLYRRVLPRNPESLSMRIGFSRALISAGKVGEAAQVLVTMPEGTDHQEEIAHLRRITQYVNLN